MASRPSALRVLLVDDNSDALRMNALLIRDMGHEVEMASDGQAAMEIAGRFRPNIAIVDLVLPDIDGCDLARDLKAALRDAVRVFMLTGHDEIVARQRAEEVGCEEYFVKPLDPHVLEHVLKQDF